jgi:hypothetical protein
MLLVYKGLSWNGTNRLSDETRQSILRNINDDDAGVRKACALLPPRPARAALSQLIERLHDGRWRQEAALRTMFGFVVAGAAHPVFAARRVVHRMQFTVGRECSMFGLMRRHGRNVSDDGVNAVLDAAHRDGHSVWTLSPDRVARYEGAVRPS